MVRIDLQGWAELDAAWRQAPDMVRRELTAAMYEAEALLEREVKDLTPVGVGGGGGLRGSIAAQEPEVLSDQVIGVVGTAMAHAVPVELGTKPHFPPVEALEEWVRRKLGVDEKRVRNVAFLVARKIAARGTPAFGMFHRAFNAHRAQVAGMFEAARNRVVARLAGSH